MGKVPRCRGRSNPVLIHTERIEGVGTAGLGMPTPFRYLKMKISVVQLEIKKIHDIEIDLPYDEIHTASYAAPLFCQKIGNLNIEHTAMVSLDNADRIINFFIVSMGEINCVKVSLAQMFRAALLSNASKIIVAHNHPSGVLEITSKDIEMTRKIAFFARSFDIELIDSLVVTRTDYSSIRSHCREFLDEQKNSSEN